ncbi:hypothetical protein [Mucilaginibacter sp. UR6-11]|uniref:hypothetical protein n=1 Tax=Mucilaginibacter sp. UR6-11 TaxID=1435644 RepID=UPI001E2929A3|nr:hypothetical protein [Mucilaginibacter sp. UR6-11]MCC8427014.1 hypothetical protein [Mucilaginibacter sp. UR6-11]
MYKLIFAAAVCFICNLKAHGQLIVRNFGFEQYDSKGNVISWDPINTRQQYSLNTDTTVAHTGKRAYSVEAKSDTVKDRGVGGAGTMYLSSAFKLRRTVKVSAFIKTENLREGAAGILIMLNGEKGPIFQADTHDKSPSGTTDWSKYELELPLTADVKSVSFAFIMTGKGKAWFDDFQVLIDDKIVDNSTW